MKHRHLRIALSATVAIAASLWLGGCVVAARQPVGYVPYGYTTAAAPNTVYYAGGNWGGTYYRPGYYARTAPFFSAQVATPTYVQPGYVQPTYVQPGYVQPVQQPYYQRPGVVVGGAVQAPFVGGGAQVIVR